MGAMMGPAPDGGASSSRMRAALAEALAEVLAEALAWYAHTHGRRASAREMSVSPSTVDRLVSGRTRPRRLTLPELERWYLRANRQGIGDNSRQRGERMMAKPDGAASLHILREAARQYIETKGLRAFGRGIGMSPWGAGRMASGESQPRATTLRKFRSWYLRAYDARDVNGGAEGAALIGIKVLVHGLPFRRQRPAALRLHGELREELGRAGKRVPRWVADLKKLIETEWPE